MSIEVISILTGMVIATCAIIGVIKATIDPRLKNLEDQVTNHIPTEFKELRKENQENFKYLVNKMDDNSKHLNDRMDSLNGRMDLLINMMAGKNNSPKS